MIKDETGWNLHKTIRVALLLYLILRAINNGIIFSVPAQTTMMENTRGEERRNGTPDYSARGRDKRQAPTGFEGMNYEQQRRPYGEARNTDNDPGDRSRDFNERDNP